MIHTIYFRVIYAETDRMGFVYYTRYLEWFERARNEYMRQIGLPYFELEDKKVFLPVIEAFCRYLRPAKYDDPIALNIWVSDCTGVRVKINCEASCRETKLAEGFTWHSFVNQEGKPIRIPPWIKEKIMMNVETKETIKTAT